jgi:hypothetical protein
MTPAPHKVSTGKARLPEEQETEGRKTGYRWIIVLGIALWLILMIGTVALITRL